MQDAFPWVDNYWDSGECGLHVHTRACVCLDPGVLEVFDMAKFYCKVPVSLQR